MHQFKGPRHFSFSVIGGKPEPRLSKEVLDILADSMGYFQSEIAGRHLDAMVSVKSTIKSGGIPTLEFFRKKQIRSLLILEDVTSESGTWNPVAREMASGLR